MPFVRYRTEESARPAHYFLAMLMNAYARIAAAIEWMRGAREVEAYAIRICIGKLIRDGGETGGRHATEEKGRQRLPLRLVAR